MENNQETQEKILVKENERLAQMKDKQLEHEAISEAELTHLKELVDKASVERQNLTPEQKAERIQQQKNLEAKKKEEGQKHYQEILELTKSLTPEEKEEVKKLKKERLAASQKKVKEDKEKEKAEKKRQKQEEKEKLAKLSPEEAQAYKDRIRKEEHEKHEAEYKIALSNKKAKALKKQAELEARVDTAGVIHRFFFSIGQSAFCQWFSDTWLKFKTFQPNLAELVRKIFFFIIFSEGVTIFQFIVMTFLPYAFQSLNNGPAGWPKIVFDFASRNNAQFVIFGDTVGWGYFISFEIAVFLAQCINFPLQRNITFKSHGNPWYQAMWYFIGWVLVSIFTNAAWGFINVFFTDWGWYTTGNEGLATIAGLVKTVLTGGISMVIFYFIFLVIFPAGDAADSEAILKEVIAERNNAQPSVNK